MSAAWEQWAGINALFLPWSGDRRQISDCGADRCIMGLVNLQRTQALFTCLQIFLFIPTHAKPIWDRSLQPSRWRQCHNLLHQKHRPGQHVDWARGWTAGNLNTTSLLEVIFWMPSRSKLCKYVFSDVLNGWVSEPRKPWVLQVLNLRCSESLLSWIFEFWKFWYVQVLNIKRSESVSFWTCEVLSVASTEYQTLSPLSWKCLLGSRSC